MTIKRSKNKFKKLLLIAGAVFACSLFICVFYFNRSQRETIPAISSSILIPYLNDGDILCRLGDRFWSLYFKDLSMEDKRFSHLGIVRVRDGIISVVNAEGHAPGRDDSVNEVSLEAFISVAKAVGIYRANFIDGADLSNAALEFIGLPFDWNFNLNDKTAIYCTELLSAVLDRVAPEIEIKTMFIKELGRDIIPLESISNSSDFTEIFFFSPNNLPMSPHAVTGKFSSCYSN